MPIDVKSSNDFNFDVVNRSHRIGRSSFLGWNKQKSPQKGLNIYVNAMSVVSNLKQFESTVFDKDLKRCCSSIYRILYKFFQGVYGGNNDLASCNFVDNVWI